MTTYMSASLDYHFLYLLFNSNLLYLYYTGFLPLDDLDLDHVS
jgi:hypothetical protein